MDVKSIFKSKTLWFFLLTLAVSVAGLFGFGAFQPTPQQAEILGIVVSVIGMILRLITKEPVSLS
jgi:hypothetical protein